MFEYVCRWRHRAVVCSIDGLAVQGRKCVRGKQNDALAAKSLNAIIGAEKERGALSEVMVEIVTGQTTEFASYIAGDYSRQTALREKGEVLLSLLQSNFHEKKEARGLFFNLAPRVGLEPTTHGLTVRCSTD